VPADPTTSVRALAERARAASARLAVADRPVKDRALRVAAELLEARRDDVLAANAADLERAVADGATETQLDRLRLSPARVEAMASGLRQVAALADPVGEVVDGWRTPHGLDISRVRVPLGVVAVIYENRPNVTSDAAGLCVKAGNAALLRGSAGALRSNQAIVAVLREALAKADLPEDAVVLVEDTSHEAAVAVMRCTETVDCLIPRGGPSLIAAIREHATVPVIIDGDGNCHVYVDAAADLEVAAAIVRNAKTQRPGVCNAAESLVVHAAIAERFLPRICAELAAAGVELVGDGPTRQVVPEVGAASEDDFAREFLALKLSIAVVDDLDAAIGHVNRYGTGHTEAIVTTDLAAARRFTREVDAAAVIVNASTRFTDGEQFGLGAEIGISTQKLHARGPLGLRELTSVKYVVWGDGQVRT
jgi:glutamate-5-semialdehyde dehydrogenase